ncbi:hypothetical protein [Parachlamydia sp. AcF125]|uniref:hypothetical protein n=1 Tax=Parachlamydia sp. AcF125 TaxID=2795736 RepID=UPI001BCA4BEE|nr:hypothetical protein [Parachlamydia sp. AcF125]MBS4167981.1 hypothetical protein [Parachlamydia sp. AcF125]
MTSFLEGKANTTREILYGKLNDFSYSRKTLAGRLLALPVAIADISLETITPFFKAIDCAGSAAKHLAGAPFKDNKCSFNHSVSFFEKAVVAAVNIPIKLVLAPVKIFIQTLKIAINPRTAQPFDYDNARSLYSKTSLSSSSRSTQSDLPYGNSAYHSY